MGEKRMDTEVMKVRVLHSDGRDEVYQDVVKVISLPTGGKMLIYTAMATFDINLDEVEFIHTWY